MEKYCGFKQNADSINKLYNWLCFRILDLETSLYQVRYTEYGIVNTFISSLKSEENPRELIYIIHSWQSAYFLPKKENLDAIREQNINMSVSLNEPQLDGWGRLITLYGCRENKLNNSQKDFVKRKCLDNINDIKPIQSYFEEETGLWRIKDKKLLLANSDDWRKCFPVNVSEKNQLFVTPPKAHFKFGPELYPYNIFEEGSPSTLPNEGSIALYPFGSFYGQP